MNFLPHLSLSSDVQYDTDSKSVGTNTRLRWTFLPVADLFVVYNRNVRSILDRGRLDSNQLLVKLHYAWRLWCSSLRSSRAVRSRQRASRQYDLPARPVCRIVRHDDRRQSQLPSELRERRAVEEGR
jgi:hypothetical protein